MKDLNDKVNNGGVTSYGQLSASEWNQLPSEVQNAIVSANIALSGGDLSQLAKSISHYATAGEFFTGAGSVNAYTATSVAPRVSPPALSDGMKIRIIAPSTNTGASTLNAFGTGAVSIKLQGGTADPSAGRILAGKEVTLTYRTSPSAHWELDKQSGFQIGDIVMQPHDAARPGHIKVPLAPTTLNIATYPELAAVYGTTWGGDGVTTFGIPSLIDGGAWLQSNGDTGTISVGEVLSHAHSGVPFPAADIDRGTIASIFSLDNSGSTDATGGANNLAAGSKITYWIKFED